MHLMGVGRETLCFIRPLARMLHHDVDELKMPTCFFCTLLITSSQSTLSLTLQQIKWKAIITSIPDGQRSILLIEHYYSEGQPKWCFLCNGAPKSQMCPALHIFFSAAEIIYNFFNSRLHLPWFSIFRAAACTLMPSAVIVTVAVL